MSDMELPGMWETAEDQLERNRLLRARPDLAERIEVYERMTERIETLEAERDTLAEIVGIISPHVEYDDQGWVGIVAGRNFHAHSEWTEADAERFRTTLDRIQKENE